MIHRIDPIVTDSLRLVSNVVATVTDGHGRIVQQQRAHNASTNWARSQIAQSLLGTARTSYPVQIAVGTGTGSASKTDQWMAGEVYGTRKAYTYRDLFQAYTAQIVVNYATTDPNGTYTEAGLWDAPTSSTTLASNATSGTNTITVASGAPAVYKGESVYINDSVNSEYVTLSTTPTGTTWTLTANLQHSHTSTTPVVIFGANLWAHVFFAGNGVTKGTGEALTIQWGLYIQSV